MQEFFLCQCVAVDWGRSGSIWAGWHDAAGAGDDGQENAAGGAETAQLCKMCYHSVMERAAAIATLKAHEAELRQLGVEHLYLFGSTARGEAREDSDLPKGETRSF
jgi:hypothetical protein